MRNKRNLIIVLLLLVVVAISGYTYARYTSSFSVTGSAEVAAWSVKITDGSSETTTVTYTTDSSAYVADGKIAPGVTATATVYLDASDSEVALDYTIAVDTSSITNENIEVTGVTAGGSALSGSAGTYTGTIALSDVDTPVELVITVEWTDLNTTAANELDTTTGTTVDSISIPVTITATQKVS